MHCINSTWLIFSILFLFIATGCKGPGNRNIIADSGYSTGTSGHLPLTDPNFKWKEIVNSRLDSLGELYTENAYVICEDGTLIRGNDAMLDHYKKQGFNIDRIAAKKRITAVHDSTIVYEQGHFSTLEMKYYSHLIIWRKENGKMLRELEMLIAENPGVPLTILKQLDKRRNEWIQRCNSHNATDLVNKLYSENTLYYNHTTMIIGRDAVIQEYQYMNRPDYKLHLSPINVQLVNRNIAFEIGQCSGTYKGNYVLVWNKGRDGVWRILLDSNI